MITPILPKICMINLILHNICMITPSPPPILMITQIWTKIQFSPKMTTLHTDQTTENTDKLGNAFFAPQMLSKKIPLTCLEN